MSMTRQFKGFGPDTSIRFRHMTDEEIARIRQDAGVLETLRTAPEFKGSENIRWLVASQGDRRIGLVVRPVLNPETLIFNSYVAFLPAKGESAAWIQKDWTRTHKTLNRFLLDSADVVIAETRS